MMVRDKSINKFYAFALAAVFSLTLAGCGGGGGGTTEEPPAPMPPTAEEMCVADKGAGSVVVDGQCYSPSENTVRMALAAIAAAGHGGRRPGGLRCGERRRFCRAGRYASGSGRRPRRRNSRRWLGSMRRKWRCRMPPVLSTRPL